MKNEYKSPKSYTCLLQKQIYAKREEQQGHPDYPVNNSLYMMLLHSKMVIYVDIQEAMSDEYSSQEL